MNDPVRVNARTIGRWIGWFALLAGVTLLLLEFRGRLDRAHVALAYLLIVLWGSSSVRGRALGISLAAAAFLLFNWFFLQPYATLAVADPLDWLVLLVFLVTGVTAAQLVERQRYHAALAERRASEIERLASLGAENLNAPRAADALDAIAAVIRDAMGTSDCEIVLRDVAPAPRTVAEMGAGVAEGSPSFLRAYTLQRGEPLAQRADGTLTLLGDSASLFRTDGVNTVPLVDLRALAIPLRVRDRVVAVLRLSSGTAFSVSDDQRRVLGALSYYAALAAERVRLAGAEEQAAVLRAADRMKDAFLAAVSHDLRTPLTAIKGIANEVWRGGDPLRARIIEQEADHLTAMVEALLELSELRAGGLRVDLALNTVDDLMGTALARAEAVHGTGRIRVDIDASQGLLVGRFDFAHAVRALTNLLDNALKYSSADVPVMLRATRAAGRIDLTLEDQGPGIDAAEAERIFEPFYRGKGAPEGVRGTGLGLAIARQLAEAQQGTVTYSPRPGGGSRFTLSLQGAEPPRLL